MILPRVLIQRGGGLGGIFGVMKNYLVPYAKKYLLPKAEQALVRTIQTAKSKPLDNNFFKDTSKDLLKNLKQEIFDKIADPPNSSESKRSKLSVRKRYKALKPSSKSVRNKKSKLDIFQDERS